MLSKAVADEKGKPLVKGHFAEGACLNCGTELIGSHCHSCGQKVHLHRTIGAFMHDLLHGALHFEGRIWHTLPKLFFKPGELTRRYIDGERARFVSPMALFLFCIFLMFAVFQFAGVSAPTDIRGDSTEELAQLATTELERVEAQLVEVESELAAPGTSAQEREDLERRRKELSDQVAGIREARKHVPFLRNDSEPRQLETDEDGNTIVPLTNSDGATMKMKASGIEWIDGGLEKWRKNPGLMLYKLQTNFYKFSWLLIPLSIPFVWLLFAWKRRFRAYDHAIFITYSISFMTLLILSVTLMALVGVAGAVWGSMLAFLPPIHMYKQLRQTYGLSRISAFWRLCVLMVFIVIVLLLFLQLLLLIGVF
nr:DUF3667 domain-containing protein [Qipengyuania polymorpha]